MSNTAQYNRGIPGVPLAALDAIQDQNTRQVLRAIVDGWHVRNGASGNGDGRFVTQGELGSSMGYRLIGGLGGSYQSSTDSVDKLSASDINRLITELQASVMTSQLWQELGTTIREIPNNFNLQIQTVTNAIDAANKELDDLSLPGGAIYQAKEDIKAAKDSITALSQPGGAIYIANQDITSAKNSITAFTQPGGAIYLANQDISGLSTRLNNLSSGVTDITVTDANGSSTLRAIKSSLGAANTLLGEISNVSSTSQSAIVQQFRTLQTNFGTANTKVNELYDVQSTSQSALVTRFRTLETNFGTANTKVNELYNLQSTSQSALVTRFTSLETNFGTANTKVNELYTLQSNSQSALVTRFTALETNFGSANTKVNELYNVQSTSQSALVKRFTTLETSFGTANTKVNELYDLQSTSTSALVTQFKTLQTNFGTASGKVDELYEVRSTSTSALVTRFRALETNFGSANAKVNELYAVQADGTSATLKKINTMSTSLDNATAAIDEIGTIKTTYNTVAGQKVANLSGRLGTAEAVLRDDSTFSIDSTWAIVKTVKGIKTTSDNSSAYITNVENVLSGSGSSTASKLAGMVAKVINPTTGLDWAKAQIDYINNVSADSGSASARAVATVISAVNQKNKIFVQGTMPVSTTGTNGYTLKQGDFWYNTSDFNKGYQYNGSTWVECTDGRIAYAVGAMINDERDTRSNNDNSLASAINTIWAAVGDSSALVQTGGSVITNRTGATATSWNQLQSILRGSDGQLISSAQLKIDMETRVGVDNWLLAKWEVKTDINGYVSGFGLAQDAKQNATPYSRFIVRADQFAIGSPITVNGTITGQVQSVPFIVQNTQTTTPDGTIVQPGVYIDTAIIKAASIGKAKIGVAEIDTLRIAGNAVTVPSAWDFSYGQINRGGWTNIAELSVDFGDQPPSRVIVMCFVNFFTIGGNTGGATLGLWVQHEATGQMTPTAAVYTPSSITVAAIGSMINVGKYTQKFKVWASHAGFGWDFYIGSGNITVLGVKR